MTKMNAAGTKVNNRLNDLSATEKEKALNTTANVPTGILALVRNIATRANV